MGSSSHQRRRERRFRRYLSTRRLKKAHSLFKRHPRLDIDAGEPPPLHRACARRDAAALRLLLHLGADPTQQDCRGNTALHAAAGQGPSAYKDFFLPLMTQCPTAMKMKNQQGKTPGELLGWECSPEPSVEVEEEEEDDREKKWKQKLQEELEDEWQEMLGKFEDDEDISDTPEPESFSAWTERLAREHSRKQRQQQEAERAQHPKRVSASYCSRKQQEEEGRLFQERAKAKEEELRESRAKKTQEARGHCWEDPSRTKPRANLTKGRERLWCFRDIPWPCLGGRDPEAMAAALVAKGPPPTDRAALRKYLRAQQIEWHPDRFLQRFGCQIEAREREKVMEIVTALSQALNRHAEGLK